MKSRACCKVLVDTRLQIPTNRGRSKTFWDNDGYSFNRAVWNSSTVSATRSEPHRTASSMHDRLVNSCRRRQLATPRTIASCSPATGWEPAAREDTHFQRSLGAQSSQVETTDRERCILKAVDQSIITHTWFSIHEVRRMESMTISSHRISQAAEEQYFIMQCPASFLREIHVSHCPTDIWVCLTLFSHWCCKFMSKLPSKNVPRLVPHWCYDMWRRTQAGFPYLKPHWCWSTWVLGQVGEKLTNLVKSWSNWSTFDQLGEVGQLVKGWSGWLKNWPTWSSWSKIHQIGLIGKIDQLARSWSSWSKIDKLDQIGPKLVKLVENWPTWSNWWQIDQLG